VVLILALPPAALSGQQAQSTSSPSSRYQAPVISDTGDLKGPRQPIFFRHDVHGGEDQIPCMYCHYSAAVSSEPGIPSLQTCIGCHQVVGGGSRRGLKGDTTAARAERAQVQLLRNAWRERKPPEWLRVHALPGFVRFPHMRHIKGLATRQGVDANATCATCHGDVKHMTQVEQVSTLRMGWCVHCHMQNTVTRDCSVCHY